jgi:hypothetical protein
MFKLLIRARFTQKRTYLGADLGMVSRKMGCIDGVEDALESTLPGVALAGEGCLEKPLQCRIPILCHRPGNGRVLWLCD